MRSWRPTAFCPWHGDLLFQKGLAKFRELFPRRQVLSVVDDCHLDGRYQFRIGYAAGSNRNNTHGRTSTNLVGVCRRADAYCRHISLFTALAACGYHH